MSETPDRQAGEAPEPGAGGAGDGGSGRAATGVPAADTARDRLGAVESAPLEEHVELFEDVHRRLQEGLADLDEG